MKYVSFDKNFLLIYEKNFETLRVANLNKRQIQEYMPKFKLMSRHV